VDLQNCPPTFFGYSVILKRRLEWQGRNKKMADKWKLNLYGSPDEILGRMHYTVQILNQLAGMLMGIGQ
jgi:pyridoxine/pyridoxamine 5'-phosphate oxidase